ncbi:MAG: cysteine-rich repeat protein [Myxococcota bacterium]|jgi:cysteine-rich repeat protein
MRLLSLAFLLLMACPGADTDETDLGTESATEVEADTELFAFEDLGANCPGGCNLDTCVLEPSDSCDSTLCLFDGRTGIDAYCTQECIGSECPPGYTCMTTEDEWGDVCFANPRECGNGIVERGEICDDGNTDDGDLCSGNCNEVTTPPSSGSFSFGPPGEPRTTELNGTEPTVFAYRSERDGIVDITLGTFQNITFSLELNDIENVTVPGPIFTDFTAVFGACNFSGIGTTTLLNGFDPTAQTVSGTFTANIACFAGCFDCGGQGAERSYEGDFDMNFVERPF